MRIGINCLRVPVGYKGGVNTYVFGLLDGFAQTGSAHQFLIFASRYNSEIFADYTKFSNFRVVVLQERLGRQWFRAARRIPWRVRFRLPYEILNRVFYRSEAAQIDALCDLVYVPHVPTLAFPMPRKPHVYTIYDLQHEHYPGFFSAEAIAERRRSFSMWTRHACRVQAASDAMKTDFLAHFPWLAPQDVPIIHEGVNLRRFTAHAPGLDIRQAHRLPMDFIYYPAQLWRHKNHLVVLQALAQLRTEGLSISLVLTGAEYEAAPEIFAFIKNHGLESHVRFLGLVPAEHVVALCQAARLVMTASLFESWTIPLLEAAAAGSALLASDIPANVEAAQILDINLFKRDDSADLARVLRQIWADDATRARQIARNKTAVMRFTWDLAAAGYLRLFAEIDAQSKRCA